MVEIRVLGPLEVVAGGESLVVPGGRERALLARLALSANRPVPAESLILDLWSNDAPADPLRALQVHVSRLRKSLRAASDNGLVATSAGGYILTIPEETVDAARFARLVKEGRALTASGDHRGAAERLTEALELWRGPALGDLGDVPFVIRESARLEEERLTALEDRLEADLACGRHRDLVAELSSLTHQHPLRERLWGQRMLALYRAGRQADALRAYQKLRTVLGDELGLDPSSTLQRLEGAILRQEPELDWRPRATAAPPRHRSPAGAPPAAGVVTFLFTDLVGSTELLDTLGDDAAEELRRTYFSLLRQAVSDAGGDEVKSLGDGLMVAFSSPLKALRGAIGIQEAIARHNRDTPASRLAVRVGLHSGEPVRQEDDFFGTAVVIAKRLCDRAEGGQILASALVTDLVGTRGGFRFIPVGPLALKGLAAPVATMAVGWEAPGGEGAAPAPEPHADPAPVLPMPALLTDIGRVFVGRQSELKQLGELWNDALEGRRRLALLAGEPGVGKTRLAAQLAGRVHAQGSIVLVGRCDEDLGVPYQPFVEALRHFVEHLSPRQLVTSLGRYAGELVRIHPDLAVRLSGLPPPLRSDPETERYRLFDAVAAWFGELSRAAPVLLVLDDLQWATRPTLLMLRHLVRSAEPTRMLIVGTYRDTELGRRHPLAALLADLHQHDGMHRLILRGLDEEGVADYLIAAAGHDIDAEGHQLAHAVWSETEGNPFFVGEVLRHLAETGALAQLDGRWVATSAIELGIPEGVREVIGRRLSRLSEQTNRVLALAAVLGPEFDLAVLGRLAGMDDDALIAVLEEAVAARLVVEVRESWSPRDRFAHALVRATLYEELPVARRVALHCQAGEAIEAIHGDHLDDHLPALSHHFAQACAGGNVTKAVDYAARAGERASTLLAHDEAVAYYRSALDLLEAAGTPADDARRPRLLCALGQALQRAGDPTHRDTLLTAARLARQHGDVDTLVRAALANTRGHLPSRIGLVDHERVAMLEAAIAAIGDRDPRSRARLLGTLGLELIFAGDWRRCLALSDEALALARSLGDPDTLARVLHTRHLPTSLPGFLAERLANTAELLSMVEAIGDPTLATDAYVLRCRAALEAGDMAEADKYLKAAERRAGELNQPSLRFRVLYVRVGGLVVAGRFAEAETALKEVAELGQATGQGDAELMVAGQTFCIRRHTGRLDHETVTLLEQAKPASPVPMIDGMLAVIACERGRDDAAREVLAAVASSPPSFDIYWLSTMANWAWVASRLGESAAAESLHAMLAPYDEHHVPFLPWPSPSVAHHLGLLATTLGRFDEAERRFAAASQIHERLGARHWVAETGLAEAEMRRARGGPRDAERAVTLIDQALRTAAELGASAIERWAATLR